MNGLLCRLSSDSHGTAMLTRSSDGAFIAAACPLMGRLLMRRRLRNGQSIPGILRFDAGGLPITFHPQPHLCRFWLSRHDGSESAIAARWAVELLHGESIVVGLPLTVGVVFDSDLAGSEI